MSSKSRDYQSIARRLTPCATREESMQRVVDELWTGLHDTGVSWVGFYIDHPEQPNDRRLVLGPCRDKPACSPIGLHGVCGQALLTCSARIVRDVQELGSNYVACDPRDRSEIVIPMIDDKGVCCGVLDLDSWDVESFSRTDADGLGIVLHAVGLV